MRLVERHIIKKSHSLFREIDGLCFLSKNLYNKANYIIRQEFISTSKQKENGEREKANWIRYHQLQKQLQNEKDFDYYQLPAKVSQQVLKTLDKNWVSFFASIKDWKNNPQNYKGKPSLPRYKHKAKGRNVLTYTIQAISKTQLKKNIVLLSGTTIAIQTKQQNIQQVRIIPRYGHYVIEIIYKKEATNLKLDKTRIAGIDLGINNLATVTSNVGIKPLIINGRPIKSMNQYFNKKMAKLQTFVANKSSGRMATLTNKRNRKVDNYLHNASLKIVNYFIKNDIGTVVIGKNVYWKTECNMGRKNNQSFVGIPHDRLIHMIKYKCELIGITVHLTEESHTSKCSFIDFESIEHHDKYLGYRRHRGLFISKDKIKINADCNGSGNIIRKVFPNAFADGIQGVVVPPLRLTPYKLAS
jgi:putative transposase